MVSKTINLVGIILLNEPKENWYWNVPFDLIDDYGLQSRERII